MHLMPIDYRSRRQRAMAGLDGGVLLALSQPTAVRNLTVDHPWRQESFLHWLTGFAEAESALVLCPWREAGDQVHLFLREKDPERELWDGRRLGVAAAPGALGIDHAHPYGNLWTMLPDLMGPATCLYTNLGLSPDYDREIILALGVHKSRHGKRGLAAKLPIFDAQELSGRLRLRKEAAEIDRLRASAAVTKKTYDAIFSFVRPGVSEREVHGLILGEFLRQGGEMEAYGSIVAGGANACILHYRDNDALLKDGEVLLIDAGAQAHYYVTDVTRTFPIGKRFTSPQRDLYELVLAVQERVIAMARPGANLTALHDAAIAGLVEGLRHLGLLTGSTDEIMAKHLYRRFYPHGTSHWIGMDVHDVGAYARHGCPLALEPGMYFSVEPGIYVQSHDEAAPAAFRGIGIRIEDDVLITAAGAEVLTAAIQKDVAFLENRH